jgi:hypothetical protein
MTPSASSANSTIGAESTIVRSCRSVVSSAAFVVRSSVMSIRTPCEYSGRPSASRTITSWSHTWT